ncbi:MAG: hypothetical protein R3F30_03990 [Planctomycetota bacterium]
MKPLRWLLIPIVALAMFGCEGTKGHGDEHHSDWDRLLAWVPDDMESYVLLDPLHPGLPEVFGEFGRSWGTRWVAAGREFRWSPSGIPDIYDGVIVHEQADRDPDEPPRGDLMFGFRGHDVFREEDQRGRVHWRTIVEPGVLIEASSERRMRSVLQGPGTTLQQILDRAGFLDDCDRASPWIVVRYPIPPVDMLREDPTRCAPACLRKVDVVPEMEPHEVERPVVEVSACLIQLVDLARPTAEGIVRLREPGVSQEDLVGFRLCYSGLPIEGQVGPFPKGRGWSFKANVTPIRFGSDAQLLPSTAGSMLLSLGLWGQNNF